MRTLWSHDTNLKGPVPTGFWEKFLRCALTAVGLTIRPVVNVKTSVSWQGSSEVGSATRPLTSVPGVAVARAEPPRVGEALVTGATSAGAGTPSAMPAPTVLTKRRRVRRKPGARREPEDATLTTF